MCGGSERDLQDPKRYGALAVVEDSGVAQEPDPASLAGQLLFFNANDHRSPVATHVRFTPSITSCMHHDLNLTIFSTGDLTVPRAECKELESFTIPRHGSSATPVEKRLEQQLLLQVGGDGIIGRRIAVSSASTSSSSIAEGVVGFNYGAIPLSNL
ncbi:hypothetical protein KVR01_010418 [Diaporthe batatas]|uniref:uncharacterized protein n=1 Tax=Diaporthe batatas TaxID=748121 RepID=UPI001D04B4D2|nr:uncharacterized protein KVR01_010418 [Diaporthe batatas]KAG8159781.1 hypothetical protein KVR01_010418 [Diaporthe batatas]